MANAIKCARIWWLLPISEKLHGIGGVMGGEESGCQPGTTNVFIESALFDPVSVSRTGRALDLQSDARFRFERGVDPDSADLGAALGCAWVLALCGGTASHPVSAGTVPPTIRETELRFSYLKSLGGVDIDPERVLEILHALGFVPVTHTTTKIRVAIPRWRNDIEGEHCLCEEVLRIFGFAHIPATSLPRLAAVPPPALSRQQRRLAGLTRVLAARGVHEVATWSFVSAEHAAAFGGGELELQNPIHAELSHMRASVLPGVLLVARQNRDRGYGDLSLCELAMVFRGTEPEDQYHQLGIVRTGNINDPAWHAPARTADVFDIKADTEAVLAACGVAPADVRIQTHDLPDWYHPGRSGAMYLGTQLLAHFGVLHPALAPGFDLPDTVVMAEIYPDTLPLARRVSSRRAHLVLPPFQPVIRDFAFLVDPDIPADTLLRAARGADRTHIAEISLFDVFEGAALKGKKSLAIRAVLQAGKETFDEQKIQAICDKIITAVAKKNGRGLAGILTVHVHTQA